MDTGTPRRLPAAPAALAASVLVLAVCAADAANVQRSGTQLLLDGASYRPVGYNQYRLTDMPGGFSCGGSAVPDSELATIFDQMKASGATVFRAWFFQSYYQAADGAPLNDPWAPFDRILNAAAARGMKVVPVLVNHWADCESPGYPAKTVEFYRAGSVQPDYADAGSFGYPMSYRQYAATVAARYAGSETVAWWQLVNEPETPANSGGGCAADGATVLRNFADDMTAVIKGADPNHLVSLGTIGTGQCGGSTDEYRHLHAGAVDLCEYHDYHEPHLAMPGDIWNGLQERLNQCGDPSVNKPLVIGESGIAANVQADGSASGAITAATLHQRARFFDDKIATQFAAGVAGYMIWQKIGTASDSPENAADWPAPYGVGPSSLTTDQTESVLRGWSGQYGDIRFDFEDGSTDAWYVAWGGGVSVSSDAAQSFTRLGSLLLTLWGTAGNTAVARDLASTDDLRPGAELSLRVHVAGASPVAVKLFTRDSNWFNRFSNELSLAPGWNTLSFVVPAQPTPLKGIGLELVNPTGWVGALNVDAVAWEAAPIQTVDLQKGLNGYTGVTDTHVASGKPNSNYGTKSALEADGADGSNGRLVTLVRWDVAPIAAGSTVLSASVRVEVSDPSNGAYELYAMNLGWTEGGATWSNTNPPANRGVLVGSLTPSAAGPHTVQLNAAGVALVQGWVDGAGANRGLMLIDAGTTDGVSLRSSNHGTLALRPRLSVTYQ